MSKLVAVLASALLAIACTSDRFALRAWRGDRSNESGINPREQYFLENASETTYEEGRLVVHLVGAAGKVEDVVVRNPNWPPGSRIEVDGPMGAARVRVRVEPPGWLRTISVPEMHPYYGIYEAELPTSAGKRLRFVFLACRAFSLL